MSGRAGRHIPSRATARNCEWNSHGFAIHVLGFATKTNALACEIPPATQASVYIVYVFKHQLTKHRFVGPKSFRGFRKVGPRSSVIGFEPITSVTQWWHRALYRCRRGHVFELRSSLNFSHLLKLCRFTRWPIMLVFTILDVALAKSANEQPFKTNFEKRSHVLCTSRFVVKCSKQRQMS